MTDEEQFAKVDSRFWGLALGVHLFQVPCAIGVLMLFWHWFIMPALGVQMISWRVAAGLWLFLSFFVKSSDRFITGEESFSIEKGRMFKLFLVFGIGVLLHFTR